MAVPLLELIIVLYIVGDCYAPCSAKAGPTVQKEVEKDATQL